VSDPVEPVARLEWEPQLAADAATAAPLTPGRDLSRKDFDRQAQAWD
jgi:hypothetical protein